MPEFHGLYYGSSKNPVAEIVPDSHWSGMWRIAWPDGRVSDMVNLSRARDAAQAIVERGPPAKDRRLFRWQIKPLGEAVAAPLVS
jgi:hypothetical protein